MISLVKSEAEQMPNIATFEDLWLLYPRREAKKDAMKAWSQMNESDQVAAIVAMADWRRVWSAQGRTSQFIPLPASWLRAERWTDEIPAEFTKPTHQSQVPVVAGEVFVRSEIPPNVQAVLDKLRSKRGTA